MQPPDPFANLTTIPELLDALDQYNDINQVDLGEFKYYVELEEAYPTDIPPSLAAQVAIADNAYQTSLTDLGIIAELLYPKGVAIAPADASYVQGGSGTNVIYGV